MSEILKYETRDGDGNDIVKDVNQRISNAECQLRMFCMWQSVRCGGPCEKGCFR